MEVDDGEGGVGGSEDGGGYGGVGVTGGAGGDGDGLAIEVEIDAISAWRDEDGVAVVGGSDGCLDGGLILRNVNRCLGARRGTRGGGEEE